MTSKQPKSQRIAVIVAPAMFHDTELDMPKTALERAGAVVTLASTTMDTCTSVYGEKVDPDALISSLKAEDFDAVYVCGGHGAIDYLYKDEALMNFLKEMDTQGKVVSSICSAGGVLARAGILSGKRATGYNMEEVEEAFSDAGVDLIKDLKERGLVIEDGNILTGSGPEAVGQFTFALLKKLNLTTKGIDKGNFSVVR